MSVERIVEAAMEIADAEGLHFVRYSLALYVDERTSISKLHEHLWRARIAGITHLEIYGQAFVEGSSVVFGSWKRRTSRLAGWIELDDSAELALTDFATWGDLQRAASERGEDELLRLRIGVPRRSR